MLCPVDKLANLTIIPAPATLRKLWSDVIPLFPNSKPVIGVIHVGALPGTPRGTRSVAELATMAREEARVYRECGGDGIIIENMHDVPYLKSHVGQIGRASSRERV